MCDEQTELRKLNTAELDLTGSIPILSRVNMYVLD